MSAPSRVPGPTVSQVFCLFSLAELGILLFRSRKLGSRAGQSVASAMYHPRLFLAFVGGKQTWGRGGTGEKRKADLGGVDGN